MMKDSSKKWRKLEEKIPSDIYAGAKGRQEPGDYSRPTDAAIKMAMRR